MQLDSAVPDEPKPGVAQDRFAGWPRWVAIALLLAFGLNLLPALPFAGVILIFLGVMVLVPTVLSSLPGKFRARRYARRSLRRDIDVITKREQFIAGQPGGSAELPILVSTVTVIAGKAAKMRCAHCDGALKFSDHRAVKVHDLRRRRVDARCTLCGAPRAIWFEIVAN
jgi:hypothetical protein